MSANKSPRFWVSIRTKLLLTSLSLMLVPWLGYQYIQGLEDYLRATHVQKLMDRTSIIAALLSERGKPFTAPLELSASHIYVRPLLSPIQIDGYLDDWYNTADRRQRLGRSANKDDLAVYYRLGVWQKNLYLFFQIRDDRVIYQPALNKKGDSDMLLVGMQDKSGKFNRYRFNTLSPGWVNAKQISVNSHKHSKVNDESRIKAQWQEVSGGYNIEIQIPVDMVGNKLAFAFADVDEAKSRKIEEVVSNGNTERLDGLVSLALPVPEVEGLLERLQQPMSRIWLVDRSYRVVGLLDQMQVDDSVYDPILDESAKEEKSFFAMLIRAFYRLILDQPTDSFKDHLTSASHFDDSSVVQALTGITSVSRRGTSDEKTHIITAAHPVINNGELVGAVAIEETSNSILILQNQAIEALMNIGLLTFAITIGVLLTFATRLSLRVRRLRDQVDDSIGPDGRVMNGVSFSQSGDELGDLGRSFQAMHERIAQYNRYLESMASKLSHELRTPITIVRSSLDNLEQGQSDEDRHIYLQRAQDGLLRLNGILTRMSEATHLEQTIQQEVAKPYKVSEIVSACVEGYRLANPQQLFGYTCADDLLDSEINGSPELLAQMLDKLVSNALDFVKADTSIDISLAADDEMLVLSVSNKGPSLPQEIRGNLFESMVSQRPGKGDQPHLGLGLYIVRLIAEYHNGHVEVDDLNDREGVVFRVKLPIISLG
jgi:dedicated sortase system histidine kinase